MNITNEIERNRLQKVIQGHYRALEPFRNLMRELVMEYAGSSYGAVGNRPKYQTMIPMIKQMTEAYQMALVANRPKIMVSTKRSEPEIKFFAKKYEVAVNNLIEEIGLQYTLRSWVLDALFGLGIIKIHMADAGEVQIETDLWMDPGKPFASNVSLDNFVYDMGAPKFEMCKFAGDAYRISYDDLKNGDIYDQNVVKNVTPSSRFGTDSDRLERISKGWEVDQDELEPMVDLLDVWVARDKMIYTFVLDRNASLFNPSGPALAVMPWDGPEFGPYHLLCFNDVPENIMPTSVVADLAEMARLVNAIMRKQSRRARSQKKMMTFTPAASGAAEKAIRAGDDAAIEVLDTKQIGTLEMGGIDAANAQFMTQVMEIFNSSAGNLTALLGLGAQADTVGQEELIHGSVGKKVAQMQYRVVDGTSRVVHDLAYMLWEDKYKQMPGEIPIDGADGYSYPGHWTPEERLGDFLCYQFDVDIYSMPYSSPSQKANALTQLLTQIYMPSMQAMMAQGGAVDFQAMTAMFAELYNLPGLTDLVKFSGLPDQQAGQGGGGDGGDPGLPSSTTRTYNRVSSSNGGSPAARSQATQGAWAQVANQQQQAMMAKPGA